MAETNADSGENNNGRLAKLRAWLAFLKRRSHSKTTTIPQPRTLQIEPHSGLYKFIEDRGKKGFPERGVIEYPLTVLYGDFKATISNLRVDDKLKSKIADSFDDGNLGVIQRIIFLSSPRFLNVRSSSHLANQLKAQLEPLVIPGNRNSPEADRQRHWIEQEAGWNDLISGIFKKPEFSQVGIPSGIARQLKDTNLDPDRRS